MTRTALPTILQQQHPKWRGSRAKDATNALGSSLISLRTAHVDATAKSLGLCSARITADGVSRPQIDGINARESRSGGISNGVLTRKFFHRTPEMSGGSRTLHFFVGAAHPSKEKLTQGKENKTDERS